MKFLIIALVATAAGDAPAAMPHADEVRLFASTMATINVVMAACPDATPNAAYVAGLQGRLHMVEADKPAFAEQASAVAAASQTDWQKPKAARRGAMPPSACMGRAGR